MPDPGEAALIERCRRGEETAYRELVRLYQRRVYWLAHNMVGDYQVAQDIGQEAFVRVFKNLGRFDLRRNFYTWLYQIVVNLSIDHLRKVKRFRVSALQGEERVSDPSPGPTGRMERSELQERVQQTIDLLPPKYQAVLALRDIQGFSCREVSRIVGCTNPTARWRLHRARKLFRDLWDGGPVPVGDGDDGEDNTQHFSS